jgi:hypothetical protein
MEKKFKIGQEVTYKSKEECGEYFYGGLESGGYVGIISDYLEYIPEKGCYKIRVSSNEGHNYSMLESEFREYDAVEKQYKTIICTSAEEMREVKRLMDEKGWEANGTVDVENYGRHVNGFRDDVHITFKNEWDCGSRASYHTFTNKITFEEFMKTQSPSGKWSSELKKGAVIEIHEKPPFWGSGERDRRCPLYLSYPIVGKVVDVCEEETYTHMCAEINGILYGFDLGETKYTIINKQKTITNGKTIKICKQDSEIRRGQAKRGTPIQSGRPGKTIRGRYHGYIAGNH